MSVQKEKRWIIAAFLVATVAILAVMAMQMRKLATGNQGLMGTGTDGTRVDSVKDLAAALKDPARRDAALAVLGENEDVTVVEMLASLAHKASDPEVRAASCTALGKLGNTDGEHVLTIACRDFDPEVRKAAIEALGLLGTPTAQHATSKALTDVEQDVRLIAAQTLAKHGGDASALGGLLSALRAEVEAGIRAEIATALGRIDETDARGALVDTLDATTEKDAAVRLNAVKALDAIDDNYRVKGVACAIADTDASVRGEAKRIFGELGVDALPEIAEALRSSELVNVIRCHEGVHRDVLHVVAGMQSPDAAESLFLLLNLAVPTSARDAGRDSVRDEAIGALVRIGPASIPPIATNVLNAGRRWPLKVAASRVFKTVGSPAVKPLKEYADSRIALASSDEANLWIDTLKAIGGPDANEAARAMTEHDPANVLRKLSASARPVAPGPRRPAPQLEEYHLVLYDGIYGGNPPNAYEKRKNNLPFVSGGQNIQPIRAYVPQSRKNLVLDLTRTRDGWQRVFVHHLSHNNGRSFAKVVKANTGDNALSFELKVVANRDAYVRGGYGEYSVSARKTGNGQYRGTYTGSFRGLPIEGTAICTRCPKRRPLRAGWEPVKPNEHPRMLFRKSDIPALRARLNTPFGREAFRRLMCTPSRGEVSRRHVALGVLYQLTGDARFAMEAIAITRREMENKDFGVGGAGHIWGPRFSNIALAYDLCRDAWPEAFRAEVKSYIRAGAFTGTVKMFSLSNMANDHPCSNYYSPICGGGAMLALTYWMEPGPPPAPSAGTELIVPPPLKGTPPKGAPVVPLRPNFPPARWIWSGLAPLAGSAGELLAALNDPTGASIMPGAALVYEKHKMEFGPIEQRYMRGQSIFPWTAFSEEEPEASGAGAVLYTILENNREGFYSVRLPGQGEGVLKANGAVLPNGAIVHLKEGLYPLLLGYCGQKDMVAGIDVVFRFVTDDRSEIEIIMAERKQKAMQQKVAYDLALADHKATGMNGGLIDTFYRSVMSMFRSHRFVNGNGGFQSEGAGYTSFSTVTPVRYAAACWQMFGQTVTPWMDMDHFPTRYAATAVLTPMRGKWGYEYAIPSQSFNGGAEGSAALNFITIGFPFIEEKYKPGVLWVWNKMKGVEPDNPESYVNLFKGRCNAIYTFLNYPLDGTTGRTSIKPQHPRECFPNHWQATTKGLYMFRNRWQDENDIVFQAYANTLVTRGNMGPDAAGLRLAGLGYKWTFDGEGKKTGAAGNFFPFIVHDNMVIGNGRAPCRVLSWEADDDGSGHVAMDTSVAYHVAGRKNRAGHGRDGVWLLDQPEYKPGITGLRAVAVDYSGKCGAPALIALVDRIEGPGERKWVWQPPASRGRSEGYRLERRKAGFTLHQGPDGRARADGKKPASMNLTFVGGSERTVMTNGVLEVAMDRAHKAEVMKKLGIKRESRLPDSYNEEFDIMVPAPEGESFFCIITLQHGEPPRVTRVSGKGLDTVVQVGGRRVSFDGTKPVIQDIE